MTRRTQVPKWVFLARYWIGHTIAKYSNLWAFLQNNTMPHCGGTRKQKPTAYRFLLDTLDLLKEVLMDLQTKHFVAKETYKALQAQRKLRPKAEQQWLNALSQVPRWPVTWASCHKGMNTGQENEVSYLIAHQVVKTSAYLKFKFGMKSISEFCVVCGQIEDLEHLFLTCEKSKQVWRHFVPILEKILPGETLIGANPLLLRNFQNKHPKLPTNLAQYLIKMILHKMWVSRCACLFDRKLTSAEDIIAQIKAEVKRRISLVFNSQNTDVTRQMVTWHHRDVLCTLGDNNLLVYKF